MSPAPLAAGGPNPAFVGPYRILGALGAGAAAQVYRVEDTVGRQLALKLLSNTEAPERFEREGEVTATLHHPGIVRVHGRGLAEGRPFLVYELIEGEDLEACFERLDRAQLLRITHEVALALAYAHERGVVHRDVKPANVLIDREGRAHVADFGLAQAIGMERLTRTGVMLGTPRYMSPEQAVGERADYGPPTDVWALGVLLYRTLTGVEPFMGQTLIHLVAQVTGERPRDPREVDPTLPTGLVEVCLRALHKEPRGRYPDAAAFAADLGRALAGESVEGRRPERIARRTRLVWALAGLVLSLLLVVVAGVAVTSFRGAPNPPSQASLPPQRKPPEQIALEAQRAELGAVVALLSAEGPAASERVSRLRRDATRSLALSQALWRDGLAALGAHESPAALQRQIPLLRELATLPASAREGGGAPQAGVERIMQLGFALCEAFLERASRARAAGDEEGARALSEQAGELLELLAACGFRVTDPRSAVSALDCWLALFMVNGVDHDLYWRAMLAATKLDSPSFHNYLRPQGTQLVGERPWGPAPRDPWERFVELRVRNLVKREPKQSAALLFALTDPQAFAKEPWAVGPRQWASTAAHLAAWSPAEASWRDLLEQARSLDPENPYVHRGTATWWRRQGGFAEARDSLARAVACYDLHYKGNMYRQWTLGKMLEDQIRILDRLGDRAAASEVWERLRGVGPNEAAAMLEEFPWVRGD